MTKMSEHLRLVARLHCMEKTRRTCACFEKSKATFCAAHVQAAKASIEAMALTKNGLDGVPGKS